MNYMLTGRHFRSLTDIPNNIRTLRVKMVMITEVDMISYKNCRSYRQTKQTAVVAPKQCWWVTDGSVKNHEASKQVKGTGIEPLVFLQILYSICGGV